MNHTSKVQRTPSIGIESSCHDASGKRSTLQLCVFVFCLAFKPSEPHLTRYLRTIGFSDYEINDEIYPVGVYANFILLLLAMPSVALFGHRTILIVGGILRLGTRFFLLFARSVWLMQLMEVTYAAGLVAEIVLFSYVFKVVPEKHYQSSVSAVQTAFLASLLLSGAAGDLFLHVFGMNLPDLFYISAVAVFLAVVCSVCWLPLVDEPTVRTASGKQQLAVLWSQIKAAAHVYSKRHYQLLSLFWILTNVVYQFAYGYESSLYDAMLPSRHTDYNGSIFSLMLLSGACSTYILSLERVEQSLSGWKRQRILYIAMAVVMAISCWAGGHDNVYLSVASLCVYFAAWELTNAAFYAHTGHCVDSLTYGSSFAPTTSDETEQLHSELLLRVEDGVDAAVSPPYALLLLLNSTAALAVQSALQYVWFQVYSLSMFTLYQWLGYLCLGCAVMLAASFALSINS